jgi:hypothetical protein
MTAASENLFPKLKLSEGTAWATPSSGTAIIYAGTDNFLWHVNDGGTVAVLDGVQVYNGGTAIGTASKLNFASGTATFSGGTITYTPPAAAGGGGGSVVFYDEGTLAGTAAILNVVGSAGTVAVSGGTATLTITSGSSNVATPTVVQRAIVTTDATSLTIAAASSGNRLIVTVTGSNASATAVTCTNVTFTKVVDVTASGGSHLTMWVGVVSGGSSGTSISVTTTATFTNIAMVEVTDALTPTAGTVRSASRASSVAFESFAGLTAGRFIAIGFANDNAGNAVYPKPTFPYVWGATGRCTVHVAYAPTGTMTFDYQSSTSQSGILAVVDIT